MRALCSLLLVAVLFTLVPCTVSAQYGPNEPTGGDSFKPAVTSVTATSVPVITSEPGGLLAWFARVSLTRLLASWNPPQASTVRLTREALARRARLVR